MKLTKRFVKQFAEDWVNAWNSGNIETIICHYSDDVIFSSPFILKNKINQTGTISGRAELKKYFEMALFKNPQLHFDLKHIMADIKSITLIYIRNRSVMAAETMVFNDEGMITEGLSHYPVNSDAI